MIKLNLGAGRHLLPGYENRDGKQGDTLFPLPDADASVDEIRASHVLEHFSHRQTATILAEWVRVLQPGGVLKIAVPDVQQIARWLLNPPVRFPPLPLEGYLMGGQTDDLDYHKAWFDASKLYNLLRGVGLTDVTAWCSEIEDCAALEVSLNLQAVKPEGWQWPDGVPTPERAERPAAARAGGSGSIKVAAIMSMPRLAFTTNMFSVLQALPPLGIPVRTHTGVFWGQGMERLLTEAVDAGFDYVFAVDYDSVFSQQDVLELIRLIDTNPDVAALFPVQARRDLSMILLGRKAADGSYRKSLTVEELQTPLLDASYGHFGLTVIRCDVLRQLPHPWFNAVANNEGRWEEGKIDEDIWFWQLLEAHGHRFCQANGVRIGHAQQLITWPMGDTCKPMHQYHQDFLEHGSPVALPPRSAPEGQP